MLCFSEAGIKELQALVNQVMPYLRSDDAEILWTICSEVYLSHWISSSEYQRIIDILHPYAPGTGTEEEINSYAANPLLQHNYENSPELSGEEESFLLFRYFLLSYLGIEHLNEHEVYSAQEQCQTLEPQIGG